MPEKPWYEVLFEREEYLRSYEEFFAGLDGREESISSSRSSASSPA